MTIQSLGSFVTVTVLLTALASQSHAQAVECTSAAKAVEVNNTTLHYVECGQGEPVVFIHGSTGSLNSLSQHAQLLAPEYRTIAYSRRYHTPNDPPQADDAYALQLHVDDLAALITELDLGPVHIVGHSYGGYVGLAFALEHPDLVQRLILGEPPVLPLLARTSVGEAQNDAFTRRVIEPARAAYKEGEIKEGLRRFLNGVMGPGWFEELPPEVQNRIVEAAGLEHRLEILTETRVYMPPLSCDALGELDRPTLLMTGEESDVRFLLITAELEKCLQGESHVMIPAVGHGMFSNISIAHDAILAFLKDQ